MASKLKICFFLEKKVCQLHCKRFQGPRPEVEQLQSCAVVLSNKVSADWARKLSASLASVLDTSQKDSLWHKQMAPFLPKTGCHLSNQWAAFIVLSNLPKHYSHVNLSLGLSLTWCLPAIPRLLASRSLLSACFWFSNIVPLSWGCSRQNSCLHPSIESTLLTAFKVLLGKYS